MGVRRSRTPINKKNLFSDTFLAFSQVDETDAHLIAQQVVGLGKIIFDPLQAGIASFEQRVGGHLLFQVVIGFDLAARHHLAQ